MISIYIGKTILAWLTLLSQIALILFLLLAIFGRNTTLFKKVLEIFKSKSLIFAFIVALVATTGSLYYSEILGYNPCKLCWFQRILMYPQVLLFGVALFKKSKEIFAHILPLLILGLIIAGYHYSIQMEKIANPETPDSCSANGEVSCSAKSFSEFGYITIPLMSFTAFALILALGVISRKPPARVELDANTSKKC